MNDPRNDAQDAASPALADVAESSEPRTIPVIEEHLSVGKVAVDHGGYRINKRVEVHEQLVDELLRHAHVTIERRPIGTVLAADQIPAPRCDGDTWIVPVVEEVVVTEKRLMLVEEVRITRVVGTHRDPQTVELRKENIEIERLGAGSRVIRSS